MILDLNLSSRIQPRTDSTNVNLIPVGDSRNIYPVPFHESFNMFDSTKLKSYKACARRYFFEYVLGWQKEGSLHHVNFGSAIHAGLYELNCYRQKNPGIRLNSEPEKRQEILQLMMAAFLLEYRKEHPEAMDNDFKPKDPATAEDVFDSYISEYDNTDSQEEILYPETGGRIMIYDGKFLTFKTDLISKLPSGKILIRDYKTGSRLTKSWQDKFHTAIQIGTYLHAARCLFGDAVEGFEIRGIFVYKTIDKKRRWGNVEFINIMVKKSNLQMEDWRRETIYWYDRLQQDIIELANQQSDQLFMNCFYRNENSCESYGSTCPFFHLCSNWTNPILMQNDLPVGFYVRRWNPLENLQAEEVVI